MESAKGTFFELGNAAPTPALKELLQVLSPELGKLPNKISIEGHTDATPYSGDKAYDNWDLSCGRANEARRIMQGEGLGVKQVSQVRGFADQRLRLPLAPRRPVQSEDFADCSVPGDGQLAGTPSPWTYVVEHRAVVQLGPRGAGPPSEASTLDTRDIRCRLWGAVNLARRWATALCSA